MIDIARTCVALAALVFSLYAIWDVRTTSLPELDCRGQSWRELGKRRQESLRRMLDRLAGEHLIGVQRFEFYAGTLVVHGIVKRPTDSGVLATVLDPDQPGELLRWYREFEVARRDLPWWWRP